MIVLRDKSFDNHSRRAYWGGCRGDQFGSRKFA
jgi:hypothetical protein